MQTTPAPPFATISPPGKSTPRTAREMEEPVPLRTLGRARNQGMRSDWLSRLSQENPFRPAGWRWQLAVRVAEGVQVPRRYGDDWVGVGVRLARGLMACRSRADRQRSPLRKQLPAPLAALEVFEGHPVGRSMLEAFLISGHPREAIAEELAFSVEVVRSYERLFYDLEGRTKMTHAYMVGIGLAPYEMPKDRGQLWKLVGYRWGPEMVRRLAGLNRLEPEGPGKEAFDLMIVERLRDGVDLLAVIDLLGNAPSPEALKLARMRSSAAELVHRARRRYEQSLRDEEGIHTMLASIRRHQEEADGVVEPAASGESSSDQPTAQGLHSEANL